MKGNKLFVGNLSYSTEEQTLTELFAKHGTVKSVSIIPNKGFGFVEMSSSEEAQSAMDAINLTSVDGRNVNVNEARPKKDNFKRSFRSY